MVNLHATDNQAKWLFLVSPDEDCKKSSFSLQIFGLYFCLYLPGWLIKPKLTRDATLYTRRYGVSLDEEVLTFYYGAQYGSSPEMNRYSVRIPWLEKVLLRSHILNFDGELHASILNCSEKIFNESRASAPSVVFTLKKNNLTLSGVGHIQEDEWQHGKGFFRFLSLFKPNIIQRCLKIRFGNGSLNNTHCTLVISPQENITSETIRVLNEFVSNNYGYSDLEILQVNYQHPLFPKP